MMPFSVFKQFRCPQMSWFVIEATEETTRKRVVRACQGYISEKLSEYDQIRLPPKLYQQFKSVVRGEVVVTPLKHDILNKLNNQIVDFRGAEILVLARFVKL
jgi:hypothetical protein